MDKNELELLKQELEQLKDIPLLEGELEWIMKVIDSPKETITSVIGQLPSNNDTTE
jgi:hypothetical protein